MGIGITHSRPYKPQGRGKIERWFKYVRDHFLSVYEQSKRSDKLSFLNEQFAEWVDAYNNKIHGTTKQTPYQRYQAGLSCVRPAPVELLNYFRQIEWRRVKKDRTIRLMGVLLEAPVVLIDHSVELRFHPEDLSRVEIFFQNRSYGFATLVNPHVNAKIGRQWDSRANIKKEIQIMENQLPLPIGQLFNGSSEGETL